MRSVICGALYREGGADIVFVIVDIFGRKKAPFLIGAFCKTIFIRHNTLSRTDVRLDRYF